MFNRRGKLLVPVEWQQHRGSFETVLTCVRNEKHRLIFHVFIEKGSVQKIGQYPSYATVAQGYIKTHRKLLSKPGEELTKAIGLAAHDAGIGAFTYIRRIFERLIRKCPFERSRRHSDASTIGRQDAAFRDLAPKMVGDGDAYT
jgi:hypothetical protein